MTLLPANVLHLRPSNFVGGPERQILRYCAGATEAKSPYRQIVATFTGVGPNGEGQALVQAARAAGLEAWGLPGGGWRDAGAVAALGRLVRRRHIGLICAHGYRADLLGTLVGRRSGIPTAWFLRGWTGENRKVAAFETCDRALLGLADAVVCLSRTQAESLPARVSRERVSIVINAVDANRAPRAAARQALLDRLAVPGLHPDGPPLVAIAGRLSPEKGAHQFLEAAAAVRQRRPDAYFLIFGDGPLRPRLQAEALRLGLGAHAHFAGHVTDWTRLLPGLDVLVNPSHREQAPNVVLEAMAAGVPVVATAVGAVPEIAGVFEGGAACLQLVPPQSPEQLAGAVLDLLADDGRRAALGALGLDRVHRAYSTATQQSQLQALFQSLLPLPRTAGARRAGVPNPPTAEALPMVSVVLPVRHEARHLRRLLDQLVRQNYPADRFEVVIADGGAEGLDDGTTALAREYERLHTGRVRWVANPRVLSSAGRNAGVAVARGEWIVFLDGHCRLPGAGWLADSMRAAGAQGALCLSRPQPLTAQSRSRLQAVIAHARATGIGHGAGSTVYRGRRRGWTDPSSSGCAYHRSVFARLGGYDESFDACEDVEFNHRVARAGIRAWLCPEAVVYYAARSSLRGLWLQMMRYGRGRVRLARKHAGARSPLQWLPAIWLAWLPFALAATWAGHGPWRLDNALGLGLYAAVVLGSSARLGWRYGARHLLAAPAVYLTIHAGLGAGIWREWIAPARAARRRARHSQPQSVTSRSEP